MTHRTAACSCGQLSVTVQGEPLRVSVCHCLACQRRTGSVFGAQARFPREGATFQGESRTWSRTGDDGDRVAFHFCPTCGATVWYEIEGYDTDQLAIPVGAFADPGFPAPRVSVYEERRHAWVSLPDDMEHHR
jgi:hypothetical protein